MNRAAVNMLEHLSLADESSFGYWPKSVRLIQSSRGTSVLISTVAVQVFSPRPWRSVLFLHILPSRAVTMSDLSRSDRCKVESQRVLICVSLMTKGIEQFEEVLISHLNFLF